LLGHTAGGAITTGHTNIAIGVLAMDGFDTEAHNLGIGYSALGGSVAGGEYNVAVGNYSLDALTSGDNNTAIGYNSGTSLTTGDRNIAIGMDSGPTVTEGDNNILIGYKSGDSGAPGGAVTTADNKLCLGNEHIANAHVQVDWTVASDKRDKTDVSSIGIGLNFINKLEPVTYYWDKRSKYDDSNPTGEHKEDKLDIGFLAQDVEVLENEYGYKIEDKTNLTTHLSEDGEQYGIQYSKFVPILVKAVQELSAQVTTLKDEINNLKGG